MDLPDQFGQEGAERYWKRGKVVKPAIIRYIYKFAR
jgi:hypothetical protein